MRAARSKSCEFEWITEPSKDTIFIWERYSIRSFRALYFASKTADNSRVSVRGRPKETILL
jgi:hypothetical protein